MTTTATGQDVGSSTPGPRLSFGSWAFAFGPFAAAPWDFLRIARYAAEAGYDGVEINGFLPHPHDEVYSAQDCARLLGQVSDLGLAFSGYAPDLTQAPPATTDTQDYLARIDSALLFCRRLGITTLRTDSVSPPADKAADGAAPFGQLVANWRRAAERAADTGVRLVWEFEPGFWLNRPREVLATLEAVDHPNFGVLFDTSHAYTGAVVGARHGEDVEVLAGGEVEYARLLAPWLAHLHLIDSDGSLHDEDTSAHLAFGAGAVDFTGVLDALGERATALPWWTVDFCFSPTTEEDGRHAVPVVRRLIADSASKHSSWPPPGSPSTTSTAGLAVQP